MLSHRTALIMQSMSLFLGVASFYYLSQLVGENALLAGYGGGYLSFLVVGAIFQNFTSVAFGSFSKSISGEQQMGTLESR